MSSSTSEAAGRIFISYRREDTPFPAGWLFDKLATHFGKDQVFKDVDSIKPGDDFVEVITQAVARCDVLLALIGDRWLSVTDQSGHRRLDDPKDFVRVEIEAALSRGVRVIPILVGGAQMPGESELPPSLAQLQRRQALLLDPLDFDSDTGKLLRFLDATTTKVTAPPEPVPPAPAADPQARARQDAERATAQRQQQIGQLQNYMQQYAARQDWYAVLGFADRLATIDPASANPGGLATMAQQQIARQTGAQRAHAVPPQPAGGWTAGQATGTPQPPRPKRRLTVVILVAVGALLVAAGVGAALSQRHSPSSSSSKTLPSVYQGGWQGGIDVPGFGTVTVSMTLGAGSADAQVGTFVNSTLECSANVFFEGGSGPVFLRLVTTDNTLGECVPFAYAEASVTSGGGLSFTFQESSAVHPNEPTSSVAPGSGVLSRSG